MNSVLHVKLKIFQNRSPPLGLIEIKIALEECPFSFNSEIKIVSSRGPKIQEKKPFEGNIFCMRQKILSQSGTLKYFQRRMQNAVRRRCSFFAIYALLGWRICRFFPKIILSKRDFGFSLSQGVILYMYIFSLLKIISTLQGTISHYVNFTLSIFFT